MKGDTVSTSAQSFVIAEKDVLPEARDIFSRIGAKFEIATFDATRTFNTARNRSVQSRYFSIFIFYIRDHLPEEQFSAALRDIKQVQKRHLLFYVAHHGMDLAFNIGVAVGRELGESAEIASNPREVRQLLKGWDAVLTDPPYAQGGTKLADARARLGLTQDQMASALNVTTRTLQNWESNIGTSQIKRKTKDLWELLGLMDDYVVAKEETTWLNTPNPTFRNKKPVELIVEGKLRDLIVEFQRLREGQPL
ncbi:MAG: helix-turn-helix domain-containing protein [Terriglobales bacterium]